MPGQCIDIGKLWYSNSAFTLFADLLLIALPMKQIAKLKLPTSQRLGLIFVFSLGILYVLINSLLAAHTDGFKCDGVHHHSVCHARSNNV